MSELDGENDKERSEEKRREAEEKRREEKRREEKRREEKRREEKKQRYKNDDNSMFRRSFEPNFYIVESKKQKMKMR